MRRALVAFTFLLAACSAAEANTGAPEIVYGRDICIECGMIISEPRFAAAYEYDGTDRVFDDIGNMLLYGLRTGELTAPTRAWVHDYHSSTWIDASEAWFVAADSLLTPMGHGLAAFGARATAEAFAADREGILLEWADLLAAVPDGPRLTYPHYDTP